MVVGVGEDGSVLFESIVIRDNGSGAQPHRYEVDVYADGERKIVANPDETLPLAISNADVHSSELG